jgi:transcriptional regulator with XRE-family HTH domain
MSTGDAYENERGSFLQGFGANVRRLRTASSEALSQETLADRSALHRTAIGKIEQGVAEPRLTTVVILADVLGVTLDQLVAGLGVPQERRPSPQARARRLEA